MKSINRKVNELEGCVFDPKNIDLSTTKIAYESLSEPEQKIMDKAQHIIQYWDHETDLTPTQRLILDKAGQIMMARIGYLFGEHYSTMICGDDSILKFMFYTRLFWF